MTDEEKQIAIAQACGWKELEIEDFSESGVPCFILLGTNSTGTRLMPPDYLNDLNAMHEAEKACLKIMHEKGDDYAFHDALILVTRNANPIHATAAQRAEAFLMTLGLCKESE
jgi:hypothetical protein